MTLPPRMRRQSYGKSRIRLSHIHREGPRHTFHELTLWIELDGDFAAAYTAGDNAAVVPTDTMKNTVYVLAKRHGVASLEAFVALLGRHFMQTYSHVEMVVVRGEETPWPHMNSNGAAHPHAFIGGSSERATCELLLTRDSGAMASGLKNLQVLKTTASGFSGFPRDEYTTLQEADDRIFATSIEASWPCDDPTADWTAARRTIRGALLDVFANQYSPSVQQTLYEMGRAALAACPLIDEIDITMPNQHHLLVNLGPFGLDNPNEVFVPTDEPHGNISATIERDVEDNA